MGDVLTDYALEFISARDDRPFFLWLAFHEPHTPITRNPAHPYDAGTIALPDNARDSLETKPLAPATRRNAILKTARMID